MKVLLACLVAVSALAAQTKEEKAHQKLDDAVTHSGKAVVETAVAVLQASRGDVPGGMVAAGMAAFDAKDAAREFKEAKVLFDEAREEKRKAEEEEEQKK